MMNSTLCIDQLLRAAQLLEQQQSQAAAAALLLGQAAHVQPNAFALQLCKLGEDYQERLISPKMRPTCFETVGLGASSTGSSRRSSPLSNSMFSSNCSSAQSTSPPNSPSTMLISSPNMIMQSTSSFQQSPQVSAQNFQTQSLMCVPTTSSPNASSPSSYSGSVASMSTRQSRAAHNELEKNRRANLRNYLDNLKAVLPSEGDSSRDTTLSLLTRARNYLRTVREQKEKLLEQRNALLAEHLRLCRGLEDQISNESVESAMESEPVENAQEPEASQSSKMTTAVDQADSQCLELDSVIPSAFVSTFSQARITKPAEKRVINFDMDGLLPALPLLYPYTNLSVAKMIA
ncbi:helix-loop-helix DNA-binding domain-containing protein [Ditylenchus destructor]|uniref:Helix-loop-helix DNA-binding domain-containing protein n=1 Tax=Ditylenchus destructor TaxID=166010 RepID=A0AAD4R3G2_9BILA|nr:helix-loop-helix DNA-binding domain-containing protein [Ditylenchus destructor]